tara:strand:+ start:140 stop:739 length:600 start_codon:yes stop_codon:yes gene_type:complete
MIFGRELLKTKKVFNDSIDADYMEIEYYSDSSRIVSLYEDRECLEYSFFESPKSTKPIRTWINPEIKKRKILKWPIYIILLSITFIVLLSLRKTKKRLIVVSTIFLVLSIILHFLTKYILDTSSMYESIFTRVLAYQVFISLGISIISYKWNKNEEKSIARKLSLLNIPIIFFVLIYLIIYAILYAFIHAAAGAGGIVI